MHEVEPIGPEPPEIGVAVENELAPRARRPVRPRRGDHGSGDVDADGVPERFGERHRQPPHTAAEVQTRTWIERGACGGQCVFQFLDMRPARGEELLGVPLAAELGRIRKHAKQGISLPQRFPVSRQRPELAEVPHHRIMAATRRRLPPTRHVRGARATQARRDHGSPDALRSE